MWKILTTFVQIAEHTEMLLDMKIIGIVRISLPHLLLMRSIFNSIFGTA